MASFDSSMLFKPVILTGLNRADMNGLPAWTQKIDEQSGRWAVTTAAGDQFLIKAENLLDCELHDKERENAATQARLEDLCVDVEAKPPSYEEIKTMDAVALADAVARCARAHPHPHLMLAFARASALMGASQAEVLPFAHADSQPLQCVADAISPVSESFTCLDRKLRAGALASACLLLDLVSQGCGGVHGPRWQESEEGLATKSAICETSGLLRNVVLALREDLADSSNAGSPPSFTQLVGVAFLASVLLGSDGKDGLGDPSTYLYPSTSIT